jgi:hypothetical protein
MKEKISNKESAIARHREFLKPGQAIYTKVEHVSQSGMSRDVSVYIVQENKIINITYLIGEAMGLKRNRKTEGLRIVGCGFDAGFEIAYQIGRALWPEGFQCVGINCRSNDHFNGDRDYSPHLHKDSGYIFCHEKL